MARWRRYAELQPRSAHSCTDIWMSPCAHVSLDVFALLVQKLKGTNPVETLNLSGKSLGVASAAVIATLIGVIGSPTSLDLSSNQLCHFGRHLHNTEGITAIADALRVNGSLTEIE